MPIRRINFTERQRIHRDDAVIVLRRDSHGAVYFDMSLNLSSYQFPPDARLFVEAYRQTTLIRFDFGTVSVQAPPVDRHLADFESEAEVMFRVRVTAVLARPGMLLGEADQLRPRNPDDEPDKRISLLPPVPADLGEEIWRVDFEATPILLVNRSLPDWKQTVRSETFRAFVYPAAFKEIVRRILFFESHTSTEDMSNWRSRWLLFATRIPGAGSVPKARDEYDDWIENAAAAFARQFTLRTRYVKELTE